MNFWNPGMTLEYVEKMTIQQAYRFYRGNKTQTANSLGIAIRTLDSKLERYEQDERDYNQRIETARAERADYIARARGTYSRNIPGPGARLPVEPAAQAPAQHAVPVSERTEVQEVLSRKASVGRPRKGS